jgi:VWFA-related protein
VIVRIAAASAIALAALAVPRAQQPVFRTAVDTVIVDVAVLDGRRPVSGLAAADFEVLDNGVPQTVIDASYETVPIDVTLLLDVSGSVEGALLRTLIRAASDVGRRLRPADRATLVAFNDRVRELARDATGRELIAATAGLRAAGDTSLHDALAFSLIADRPQGRRQMMIALTDGRDTMSVLDAPAVLDTARRSDTAMFFVVLSPTDLPPSLAKSPLIESLASLTGGAVQMLAGNADLSASFLRAFDDFRTSYVVRYTATGVKRGGWHEITIRVKRPANATVRARKGYFGGT